MRKRFIIIPREEGEQVFCTDWFEYENNWNPDGVRMVIDVASCMYTEDGIHWEDMEEDHL